MLSAPALAERGRSQIASVSQTNQHERGLEQDGSAAKASDPANLSFTQERPARSYLAVSTRPGRAVSTRPGRAVMARRSGPAVTTAEPLSWQPCVCGKDG